MIDSLRKSRAGLGVLHLEVEFSREAFRGHASRKVGTGLKAEVVQINLSLF